MPDAPALLSTDLPFPRRSGKVRDVYDPGDALPGELLVVATDRISAFDCVMPDGVPGKGKLLTAVSAFWFARLGRRFDHHLIAAPGGDPADYPAALRDFAPVLSGRTMRVKKAAVVPIECVARGYLAGGAWAEYAATGRVGGIALPPGLRKADRLPAPVFTPTTKADAGHDEPITYEQLVAAVGPVLAGQLRERTLRLYTEAADYARTRGLTLADTKVEFGHLPDGRLILIDEVLTPDSSRYWPAEGWPPGAEPPSFDKQFVRDWLASSGWDRRPPAPPLPREVIAGTRSRYVEAFERLTGRRWA